MNYVEKEIHINNQRLILNNLRAVFWADHKSIIVSDLHVGKSKHFRKHGIPISSKVQESDLERLHFLITLYKPERLIIVGDLFHSGHKDEVSIFKKWLERFPLLEVHLIKGNHDRISSNSPAVNNLYIYDDELKLTPFIFVHIPIDAVKDFTISGHLHPGIRLKARGRPGITLPCFKLCKTQLVLPAFSLFTGLATESIRKSNSYYAFTDTSFYEF